jgi:hypothetical protein
MPWTTCASASNPRTNEALAIESEHVIIDGSTDGTVEMTEEYSDDW